MLLFCVENGSKSYAVNAVEVHVFPYGVFSLRVSIGINWNVNMTVVPGYVVNW